jgi:hypothetical protein
MRHVPLVAAVLAGCISESDFVPQEQVDTFEQAPDDKVDILWVIDDSFSMGNEQATLAAGFESFAGELEISGADFQIGVVTTSFEDADRGELIGDPPFLTANDDYVRLFQERAAVGVLGSDKEKGLEVALWAVSAPMVDPGGANQYFLRPSAQLVVLIVSDEEDCSDNGALDGQAPEECYYQRDQLTPVPELVDYLRARKGSDDRVTVSAIVGKPDSECDDVWAGTRYIQAASLTGGYVGDICESSWDSMLATMGLRVGSIRDQFQLTRGAIPDTIEVEVDEASVEESPEDGWSYDATTRYLQFHGDAVPERGALILVRYTVDPGYVAPST